MLLEAAPYPRNHRNKPPIEIQWAARVLVEAPAYQKSLWKRLLAGKATHMEPLLFYYAYGKPVDKVALTDPTGERPYQPIALIPEVIEDATEWFKRYQDSQPNNSEPLMLDE